MTFLQEKEFASAIEVVAKTQPKKVAILYRCHTEALGNLLQQQLPGSELSLICLNNSMPSTCHSPPQILSDEAWLEIPDGKLNTLICLDLLEHLRFDQIYMIFSEARRTLASDGLFLLSGLSQGETASSKFYAQTCMRLGSGHRLEFTHYISPEDWSIHSNKYKYNLFSCRQTISLKKLIDSNAAKTT